MFKKTFLAASVAISMVIACASLSPTATGQSEATLVGEWMVSSTPINDRLVSPMGNTLGFPNRHMVFEQQGDLHTAFVAREDAGPDINPLGVWRLDGERFSATFQLWCQDPNVSCGTIVMRGTLVSNDRIRGTMTAFFEETDVTTPTGYDTWTFSFRGDRIK
jgi:hypothetical protein